MSSRHGTFRGSRPQGQTLRTCRPGAEGHVWGQKDDTPRRGAWPPPAGLPVRAAGRRWGGGMHLSQNAQHVREPAISLCRALL